MTGLAEAGKVTVAMADGVLTANAIIRTIPGRSVCDAGVRLIEDHLTMARWRVLSVAGERKWRVSLRAPETAALGAA